MFVSDNEKELIKSVEEEIFIKKNFSEVIDFFSKNQKLNARGNLKIKKMLAFLYLQTNQYKEASEIYSELDLPYQQGFCELLQGHFSIAQRVWLGAENSPAINWARCLLDYIWGDYFQNPTFLQIRNFYELSIEYFLQANQTVYAENLINCVPDLAEVNMEVYKYTGRALLNSDYYSFCLQFFQKSAEIMPQDPEIYFHIGQYYLKCNNIVNAKFNLEKCLRLNSAYTSAELLLKSIQ